MTQNHADTAFYLNWPKTAFSRFCSTSHRSVS